MTHTVEFIVLSTTRTGERTVVVHTLCRELGRRGFLVGSGCAGALLEPLGIVEAEVSENPKSDLWRAKNLVAVHPLTDLRLNRHKSAISMFLSELLYRTVHEDVFEQGLYDWVKSRIILLDAMESDFSSFHVRFLLDYAEQLGYEPSFEALEPFSHGLGEPLRRFVESPFADSMLIPLTGRERGAMAEILVRYLSVHMESRIELRSLRVLKELYESPPI